MNDDKINDFIDAAYEVAGTEADLVLFRRGE